ncbi:MAG TPA: DUF2894 domain-containing protein, partial [Hydrogenophaga sp.]
MSDSASPTAPDALLEALLARVAELPSDAVVTQDPLRLHYVRALARRLELATPGVQAVLRARLETALADLAEKVEPQPNGSD